MTPAVESHLTGIEKNTVMLLEQTGEELWQIAHGIHTSQRASAEDWEHARQTASHLLAVLESQYTPQADGGHSQTPANGATLPAKH